MDDEENILIEEMQSNLDDLFKHIGSKEYQQEVENNKLLCKLGKSLADQQENFIKRKEDINISSPTLDQNQPQNVKQANSQFKVFTNFVQSEEKKIDKDIQELMNLNKGINQSIEEMFEEFCSESNDSNQK